MFGKRKLTYQKKYRIHVYVYKTAYDDALVNMNLLPNFAGHNH